MKIILKFVQHHSWLELLRRMCIAATKGLFGKRSMFIMGLRPEAAAEPDPSIEIKELTHSDVEQMLKVMYLSRADIYNRFDRGDRCFAVLDGGKIVTYIWAQFIIKRMGELLLDFKLKPNQVWFYNAVTIKNARGRGYYRNIMRYTAKTLRAEGFDELFGYSEQRNLPSIRGLEKAGYTRIVLIRMEKILSKTKYYLTIFDNDAWQSLAETIDNLDNMKWTIKDKP